MSKKLSAKDRATLRGMAVEAIDLRYNWQRRFRNAVLGLALSDPQWITFVEKEIDPATMTIEAMTRLIEARARFKVLRSYSYIRVLPAESYFRDSWFFTDRGSLSPG